LTVVVGKYILLISYLAAIPNISKRTSPAKVRRTILSLQKVSYRTATVFHLQDKISAEFDNKTGAV